MSPPDASAAHLRGPGLVRDGDGLHRVPHAELASVEVLQRPSESIPHLRHDGLAIPIKAHPSCTTWRRVCCYNEQAVRTCLTGLSTAA